MEGIFDNGRTEEKFKCTENIFYVVLGTFCMRPSLFKWKNLKQR